MDSGRQPFFWDAVRSWADAAGLLRPTDPDGPVQPTVPQAVCDSCPICQAAATLDQVNPDAIADLAEMARGMMAGLASAMASASDQRAPGQSPSDASEAQSGADGSDPEQDQPEALGDGSDRSTDEEAPGSTDPI